MRKLFKSVYVWLLIVIIPLVAYGATRLTSVIIENSQITGGTISGGTTISGTTIVSSPIGNNIGSASTGNFTTLSATSTSGGAGTFTSLASTGNIGTVSLPIILYTGNTCTPLSTEGNGISCQISISLGVTLPDTKYFVTCSGSTANGAFSNITISQIQKSTSSIALYLTAPSVPTVIYSEIDCLVIGR